MKELDGILKIPTAGSIFSSLEKETSGWNQAQVTWTHNDSTSVGLRAPPKRERKYHYKKKQFRTTYMNLDNLDKHELHKTWEIGKNVLTGQLPSLWAKPGTNIMRLISCNWFILFIY